MSAARSVCACGMPADLSSLAKSHLVLPESLHPTDCLRLEADTPQLRTTFATDLQCIERLEDKRKQTSTLPCALNPQSPWSVARDFLHTKRPLAPSVNGLIHIGAETKTHISSEGFLMINIHGMPHDPILAIKAPERSSCSGLNA